MTIKSVLENSREFFCSLLFPQRCPVCDELLEPEEIEKGIHSACESKLYFIYEAVCMHCGRPIGDRISNTEEKLNIKTPPQTVADTREYCYDCIRKGYTKSSFITQAKAIFLYKGAIKKSMYRLKYSNKREYADFFAKCARMRYSAWIKDIGIEAIVPVPLYKAKKRRRGYNQAESFAKALGRAWNLPVNKDLVYRVRNTTPQKGLSTKERKENLEKAFDKGKSTIRYNTVLLVDDIYTTGSTAEAVASELFQRGIKQVYFLSICIGE